MNEENVIYTHLEEMKWQMPAPRKMSRWVAYRFLAGMYSGPWAILGLAVICTSTFFSMFLVGQAFEALWLGKESMWLALLSVMFSLLFPAFWLGIVGHFIYTGLQNRRLLEIGEIGQGKVLGSKTFYHKGVPTAKRVEYEFTASDGETYTVPVTLPPQLILDETAYHMLFYDPQKPRRILPYAALAWYGISLAPQMGKFCITSGTSCVYTVIVAAVNLFLFTLLLMLLGAFFGLWAW